jgi:hypothetical protein
MGLMFGRREKMPFWEDYFKMIVDKLTKYDITNRKSRI